MKLELLSIHAANNPACMLVQMRGQSGEVYHFQGGVSGDQRVEDMLTHIAGEIAATRRKKPRPTFKTKSLMPATWGKSKAKILTAEPDGSVTVRQTLSKPVQPFMPGKTLAKRLIKRGKKLFDVERDGIGRIESFRFIKSHVPADLKPAKRRGKR